ncbi:MAG TPA: V-type ATP synthase subunit A [Vicinamibacterales bacterium]|nr:V-type ATP synthase subunit A [Vicinamibacterales bacterium]
MPGPEPSGALIDLIGPVARARMTRAVALGEVMWVGSEGLYSEVVALDGGVATLQVYEPTVGLEAGTPVVASGFPLRVQLGPGLLGSIFDGLQRPLDRLAVRDGDFLRRGGTTDALDVSRLWTFEPSARAGDSMAAGALVGVVAETPALRHLVLVPPGVTGRLQEVAPPGDYRVTDTVATVATADHAAVPLRLAHFWPARRHRPCRWRLSLTVPLVTGQRVLDCLFPAAAGAAVAMPGGFGTGKTVLQQQLCKWADADVIVFIGCGERGNEMAEVLAELPALVDPRSGRPLRERTVLIANTSDMPVAAREASIHVGASIAEYYRDMGHRVLLLADSTSRWAEALREISGRLEEMPAEEGYPPYLAGRLASFYERAGRVTTLGGLEGSLTIVGAISPPGADLTEPVTRHTERLVRALWSLDREMAHARRFPAVSVSASHSGSAAQLAGWWREQTGFDWAALREEAMTLLQEADRLERTARLIGTSSLPGRQQLVLACAALLQDGFLRQAAGAGDDWCSPRRQVALLDLLLSVTRGALAAEAAGAAVESILALPILPEVRRASTTIAETEIPRIRQLAERVARDLQALTGTRGEAA